MRIITTTILAACLCVALVNCVPVPNEGFKSQALDRLMVVEADNESALRSKRTIGLLRQLFPDVSKMIDDKVNMIIGEVFKIFGPVVIQSVLGGNRGGGGGLFGGGAGGGGASAAAKSNVGTTVDVKSPFDNDDDDGSIKSFVDDDDFFSKPKEDSGTKISLELPTVKPTETSTTTSTSTPTEAPRLSEEVTEGVIEDTTENVTINAII